MIGILAAVLVALSAEENPAAPGLEPSPALVHRLAAAVAAKGPEFHPNTRHLDAHGRPLFTNRLILETSPYLLQHANNPVSWYAWGDEPFARAAHEHKPRGWSRRIDSRRLLAQVPFRLVRRQPLRLGEVVPGAEGNLR